MPAWETARMLLRHKTARCACSSVPACGCTRRAWRASSAMTPASTSQAEHARAGSDPRSLTAREREVARLVDRGLSNKEIASHLSIELPTVKNHVHSILEKVNVSRRDEAAVVLRNRGLLD